MREDTPIYYQLRREYIGGRVEITPAPPTVWKQVKDYVKALWNS